jgi:RNA polymerase sigma-70 factor, ECF subfamily
VRRARIRAFEEAALVHVDELFRIARRLSSDRSQAEDLLQETFLRAWEGFDRFEPGTNCRAWLYRIFFRTLSARRHELRRELAMFDDQPFDEERQSQWRDREQTVTPHQIEKAFASLPVAFATVITLIDVEGFSYKEASAALEVPIGTVMSRLHRGRRLLRDHLCPSPPLLVSTRGRHD